jgi:hypothetical protein
MPLRVLDDGRRIVETHWLIVEQRTGEGRKVVALQISAGVGDSREARSARL